MIEKLTHFTFALAGLMALTFVLISPMPAFAQSAPIGEVRELSGAVTIERGDQAGVPVSLGDQVFQNDVIETGSESGIGVTFIDGTDFGLGADARMILDEFAYDPAGNSGAGVLQVVEGSFAFISGGLTKVGDDALRIETPTMTIGIRGTTGSGKGGPEGTLNYITLERDEDGSVGKILASNDAGSQLLTKANQRTETDSRKKAPRTPYTVTQDDINQGTGRAIKHLPGKADTARDKDTMRSQHINRHMDRQRGQHIEKAGEDAIFRASDRQIF